MKNITQCLDFSAASIIPFETPKEVTPDSTEEELSGLLHDQYKSALLRLGVKNPFDAVKVYVNLGHFLADLYVASQEAEESPLKKRAQERQLQKLSEVCLKDDVELEAHFLEGIRKSLEDAETWKKVNISAYTEVEGKKVYFYISSKGMEFFKDVLNSALDMVG